MKTNKYISKYMRWLIILLLTFSYGNVISQISCGIQASYIAPSGDLSYFYKPTTGYDLTFKAGDLDRHIFITASLGYYSYSTTTDTFYNFTLENDAKLIPSYDVVKSYKVYTCGIGGQYKIFSYPLSPFIGLQAHINEIEYHAISNIRGLINSDNQDYYGSISFNPSIGISYELKETFVFSLSLTRNIIVWENINDPFFWKTAFNISYHFEDSHK